MPNVLQLIHLKHSYPEGDQGRLQILHDISLHVARGEIVALMGKSGSGKSTMLHMAGLRLREIPVTMNARSGGVSSITPLTEFPKLNGSEIRRMVYAILTQKQREKFEAEHEYIHHFVKLVGYNPATPWPQGVTRSKIRTWRGVRRPMRSWDSASRFAMASFPPTRSTRRWSTCLEWSA